MACRGFPAQPQSATTCSSLKDRVLDLVTMQPQQTAAARQAQAQANYAGSQQAGPIAVRRGPVPTSRWRLDGSLGPTESSLIDKRSKKQLVTLQLPQRYTNIASLRISAPSDMCMEKYSFVGSRAASKAKAAEKPAPHIIRAKEVVCQHGKYLQTVYQVVGKRQEEGRKDERDGSKAFKSRSFKSSPMSVLVSIRSSGTSSTSSSGRFDQGGKAPQALAPAGAAPAAKKKKKTKKKGLDLISTFLHKCIMSGPEVEACYK